ncbi:hypothetical protein ACVIYL_008903 [Bradyrhizobium sp. USDA 3315]
MLPQISSQYPALQFPRMIHTVELQPMIVAPYGCVRAAYPPSMHGIDATIMFYDC